MYTLYWDIRTRAAAPHMVLAESGLPYKLNRVDIPAGELRSSEFLTINPKGFLPVLTSDYGLKLSETSAIMMYLADHHGLCDLAPLPGEPARAAFLEWFSYHTDVLQEPYKRFHFPHRYCMDEAHIPSIKARAAEALDTCWRTVDAHLAQSGPYHLGERFSMIDIYMATFAVFQSWNTNFATAYPAVVRCYERLKERPALHDILCEHEISTAAQGGV